MRCSDRQVTAFCPNASVPTQFSEVEEDNPQRGGERGRGAEKREGDQERVGRRRSTKRILRWFLCVIGSRLPQSRSRQ